MYRDKVRKSDNERGDVIEIFHVVIGAVYSTFQWLGERLTRLTRHDYLHHREPHHEPLRQEHHHWSWLDLSLCYFWDIPALQLFINPPVILSACHDHLMPDCGAICCICLFTHDSRSHGQILQLQGSKRLARLERDISPRAEKRHVCNTHCDNAHS